MSKKMIALLDRCSLEELRMTYANVFPELWDLEQWTENDREDELIAMLDMAINMFYD